MKKVFFGLMAVALISATTSCKKCGYCTDAATGAQTTTAVCKSGNPVFGSLLDEYDTEKANCTGGGGIWVVD